MGSSYIVEALIIDLPPFGNIYIYVNFFGKKVYIFYLFLPLADVVYVYSSHNCKQGYMDTHVG